MAEKVAATKDQSKSELKKEELIDKLEDSTSFANTHAIIEQLSKIDSWSVVQKRKLIRIALTNYQVTYILKDKDVQEFYDFLCDETESSEEIEMLKEILDSEE